MLGPDRSEKHAAGVASLRPLQGGSSVVTLNAGAEVGSETPFLLNTSTPSFWKTTIVCQDRLGTNFNE
jgi:hypothetical protein